MEETICYNEKAMLEADMKIPKPHKTSFYKDDSGFTYCKICEDARDSTWPREYAKLIESKRRYLRNQMQYPNHKAKPLRHNQKITNEQLKMEFDEVEGKYLKIDDLKFVWENFIEVNDSNKTTTVVSSSYLRRLGKITNYKWTQQRAKGEDGEKLVIFRQTEEKWVDPKEASHIKRLQQLQMFAEKRKITNEIEELKYRAQSALTGKSDLEFVNEKGNFDPDVKTAFFENIEEQIKILESFMELYE